MNAVFLPLVFYCYQPFKIINEYLLKNNLAHPFYYDKIYFFTSAVVKIDCRWFLILDPIAMCDKSWCHIIRKNVPLREHILR